MQTTNLNGIYKFVEHNKKAVDELKVTSLKQYDFNSMEGYQVQLNVKVITKPKFKNCLIKVFTNSTYIEDFYPNNIDKNFMTELKSNILDWLYTSLD